MAMTLRSGEALSALIDACGYSDNQFAKLIGRDRSTVSHWTTGRRRNIDDDTARRILEVLGDTRDILFTAETSPVSSPKVAGGGTAA